MKRYNQLIGTLSLAVLFCAATFAAPRRSDADVLHIKGLIKATEDHTVAPPVMNVQLTATGHATHLGLYVLTADESVVLATLTSQGRFQIDAEGRSTLFGTVVGQGTPTDTPNEVLIEEVYTITGGTRRFDGATGTLTVNRVVDRSTLNSSGTIEGSITLPDHRECR